MSNKIRIKGKEYEVNKDGSPKMAIHIDSDGFNFTNSISNTRKYYYFNMSPSYENYDLAIFIYKNNKNGRDKIKEWLESIAIYGQRNTPIKVITNGDYEEIKILDSFKILGFNIEIVISKEIDFTKNIRSIIGKRSYNLQLSSDNFLALKDEIFNSAEKRCQICNDSKSILIPHHRSYKRLGTKDEAKDIICICKECHKIIHKYVNVDNTIEKKEIM